MSTSEVEVTPQPTTRGSQEVESGPAVTEGGIDDPTCTDSKPSQILSNKAEAVASSNDDRQASEPSASQRQRISLWSDQEKMFLILSGTRTRH